MADQMKIEHYEMSAKTGENVEDLFYHIIDCLLEGKSHTTESTMKQIK